MSFRTTLLQATLTLGIAGILSIGCTGTLEVPGDPDGAPPPPDAPQPPPVDTSTSQGFYDQYVSNPLDANCGACHRVGRANTPFLAQDKADDYSRITTDYARYITADYNDSDLYKLATANHFNPLNEAQRNYLRRWIARQYGYTRFTQYVQPALNANCAGCHRNGAAPKYLAPDPADDFVHITTNYTQYFVADYNASSLYTRAGNGHSGSTPLDAGQLDYLKAFIVAQYGSQQ